jgi:hypothetical protein
MRQIDLSPSISRHPKKKRTLFRSAIKIGAPVLPPLKTEARPVIFLICSACYGATPMMSAAVNYAADKSRFLAHVGVRSENGRAVF